MPTIEAEPQDRVLRANRIPRSHIDQAVNETAAQKAQTHREWVLESKVAYEMFLREDIRTACYPRADASIDLEQRDHDVIAFFGAILRREDAIALAYQLRVPELVEEALSEELCWDVTPHPKAYSDIRSRLAELLPGAKRFTDEPGVFDYLAFDPSNPMRDHHLAEQMEGARIHRSLGF